MLRGVRTFIAARGNHYFAKFAEIFAELLRIEVPLGQFGAERFQDDPLREPHQIWLRVFRVLRAVVRNSVEQQMNCFTAGFRKRAVDGACRFLWRKAARTFQWRSEPGNQPQYIRKIFRGWRCDRSVDVFTRGISTESNQRR